MVFNIESQKINPQYLDEIKVWDPHRVGECFLAHFQAYRTAAAEQLIIARDVFKEIIVVLVS